MAKKQRYGGLSAHYVRLIRKYLRIVQTTTNGRTLTPTAAAAHFVWSELVLVGEVFFGLRAGLGRGMLNALKAGLVVLRRKRVGRLRDLSPQQSFAAIGITVPDTEPVGG